MNIDIKNKNIKELEKLKKNLEKQIISIDKRISDLSYSFNKSGFLKKFKKFVESKKELCLICPVDYNDIYMVDEVKEYLKNHFTEPEELDQDEYGEYKIIVYTGCDEPTGNYDDKIIDTDYPDDGSGGKYVYSNLDETLTKKYNPKYFDKLFNPYDCTNYYCTLTPYDPILDVEDIFPPDQWHNGEGGHGYGTPTLYKIIKKDVQGRGI